jgi:hypothetical protein
VAVLPEIKSISQGANFNSNLRPVSGKSIESISINSDSSMLDMENIGVLSMEENYRADSSKTILTHDCPSSEDIRSTKFSATASTILQNLTQKSHEEYPTNSRPQSARRMKNSLAESLYSSIKVALRIRPLSPKDHPESYSRSCLHTPDSSQPQVQITSQIHFNSSLHISSLPPTKSFTFDYVFTESSPQAEIYETCVKVLVEKFINGYNCTTLAYGQVISCLLLNRVETYF